MKNMELVYAIYRYGSFSRAAEELYISQSSLSTAIQNIETELGTPLFDRRQHPVQLTAAGEEFLRYYRAAKPLQEDMLARIQDIAQLRGGSFALGGTHYLLSYILPEAIVEFSRRYPQVDLRIVESESEQFKDLLFSCDIDLCLMCDASDQKLRTIGHAFFDRLYLAVPRCQVARLGLGENALTSGQILETDEPAYGHFFRTEDLPKMTFLQLTPGNNLCSRSEEIFKSLGAAPGKIIRFNQFVTAYNLAGSGLGCTLASSRLIAQIDHPGLVYYTLPSPLMVRDFHFTTRKDAYLSRGIRTFCQLFAECEKKRTDGAKNARA